MDDRSRKADRPRGGMPDAVTALVHLYRGELGRMTADHQGLDSTTSWAIAYVGAVATVSLSSDTVSHAVMLVGMVLMLYFLVAEARRFRQFEVSRDCVQMLERGFFPDVLAGDTDWTWVDPLLGHLRDPKPPLDIWAAVGWRLRRNYLWIYFGALVTWLIKLELTGGPSSRFGAFVVRAGVGPLPGWMVMVAVLIFYAGLLALAVIAARRYPQGGDW
jgi:uncharacterized membrane protein